LLLVPFFTITLIIVERIKNIRMSSFFKDFMGFVGGYKISETYLVAAGGGAIMAFWAAESYHKPIYFTGYLVLAIVGPFLYNMVVDVVNHLKSGAAYTNASVENMVSFLTYYPKTSIAYFGFAFTLLTALFATSNGVSPIFTGWILIIGMGATAATILGYLLMSMLNKFMPLLNAVIKMLDVIEKMIGTIDDVIQSFVDVINSVTSVFQTLAGIINSILGGFNDLMHL